MYNAAVGKSTNSQYMTNFDSLLLRSDINNYLCS
jgi:hypothetical protein